MPDTQKASNTDTPSPSLLSIQDLTASRGNRKIISEQSLEIKPGKGPLAIIGESGSGKTTLLLCATGLLTPDSGEIRIRGESIDSLSLEKRARSVGLVFQDYQLFPHLSVRENIELAPSLSNQNDRSERMKTLLDALGIGELAERMPHELSGGQKQRVAIARSLILEPGILFLDEPSAALDEKTSLDLAELLKELNHRVQIIVVSHDRLFVEACCDRGIRMQNGRISPVLPIAQLFEP
jgi:ABC-type sulfate/molybdate transport systems ATPase subunit